MSSVVAAAAAVVVMATAAHADGARTCCACQAAHPGVVPVTTKINCTWCNVHVAGSIDQVGECTQQQKNSDRAEHLSSENKHTKRLKGTWQCDVYARNLGRLTSARMDGRREHEARYLGALRRTNNSVFVRNICLFFATYVQASCVPRCNIISLAIRQCAA